MDDRLHIRLWTAADIAREAAILRAGYAQTGDARLARAAAELAPRGPGRPPHDDTAAIERMAALLEADPALRPFTAASIVAEEIAGPHATRSTAKRPAEKYKRTNELGSVQEIARVK